MCDPGSLEQSLSYQFRDPDLLRDALTHPSYAHENRVASNESLGFLGDRVLELSAVTLLLEKLGPLPKGRLTPRLHRLIQGRTLSRAARALGVEVHMRVGESRQGEVTDKMLAQSFSALLGAIYLDGGLNAASTVARRSWEGLAMDAGAPGL